MAGTIIGYDQDGNPNCRCADGNVYTNCGSGCECCDQVGKTIVGYDEDGNPNCLCSNGNIYTNCGPNCECCDQVGFLSGYGITKEVRKADSTARNKEDRAKKSKTANKIIRSNSVNQNFDVEYSVTKEKVGSSAAYKTLNPITKLIITPRPGYVIDAKNFSTSSLPKEVKYVVYTNESSDINESNRVIANVKLKRNFVMPKDFVNIVLPINGTALKPRNKINLTFKTPVEKHIIVSNVLNNKVNFIQGSSSGSSHPRDGLATNSYKFTGSGKTKITKMTIGSSSDRYFSNEPTCIINSKNKKNYKVTTKNIRDRQKHLKAKIFSITYTFPKDNVISNDDVIMFNASTSVIKKQEVYQGSRKKTPIIQAFNIGKNVKKNGGDHPISVVGTPGTRFKILVQDDSQNILDSQTGAFSVGGSFIKGQIPAKLPGDSFAIWKYILRIPKVTTSRELTVRLESDANSSACGDPSNFTRVLTTNGIITPTIRQDIAITNRFTAGLRDYSGSTTDYSVTITPTFVANSAHIFIGPGVNKGTENRVTATWIVGIASKSGVQGIVIARQPRFAYGATFADWGGTESDHTKNLNSSGNTITMDWELAESSNSSNKYSISTSVKGLGNKTSITGVGDGGFGRGDTFITYQEVEITVTIHGVVYGTAAINQQLALDNFLEIITSA